MYTCWTILSVIQLFTNRYCKARLWRHRQLIHTITGLLTVGASTAGAIIAFSLHGWKIGKSWHTLAGVLTLFGMIVLSILGILALAMKNGKCCCNMDWKTPRLLALTQAHRWFARSLIVASQLTISLGVMNYFSYEGKDDLGWVLIACSNSFFFALIISCEVIHQCRIRKESLVTFEVEDDL